MNREAAWPVFISPVLRLQVLATMPDLIVLFVYHMDSGLSSGPRTYAVNVLLTDLSPSLCYASYVN